MSGRGNLELVGSVKAFLRKNRDDSLGHPFLLPSPQDRVPFVVAERVPWEKMCETLNLKFMAEVGTNRGLLPEHFLFLAQKIFNDNSLSMEAFQHRSVSWSQFNKVIPLPFGPPILTSSSCLGHSGPPQPQPRN